MICISLSNSKLNLFGLSSINYNNDLVYLGTCACLGLVYLL